MTEADDGEERQHTHYLDILNKHLTRRQLPLPKVVSCLQSETLTGPLFTVLLRVAALSIEKVGTGGTKQEARNAAAREVVAEIERQTVEEAVQPRVLGAAASNLATGGVRKKKNAIALLHEFVQKHKLAKPTYQVIQSPGGSKTDFIVQVGVGQHRQEGRGSNKKVAREDCSKKLYADLKREICDEEVEDETESSESVEKDEEEEEEEEEEMPHEYHYKDLAEFQGSVRSTVISEYGSFRTGSAAAQYAPVNLDELPDLEELNMTRSQIIEEHSDSHPVRYETCSDWHFANILVEKATLLGNIDLTFEKLKDVDNVTRSFLCFLTIRPKPPHDHSACYMNMSHGITLEVGTETLAYVTLRQAEILGCNLSELVHLCSDVDSNHR